MESFFLIILFEFKIFNFNTRSCVLLSKHKEFSFLLVYSCHQIDNPRCCSNSWNSHLNLSPWWKTQLCNASTPSTNPPTLPLPPSSSNGFYLLWAGPCFESIITAKIPLLLICEDDPWPICCWPGNVWNCKISLFLLWIFVRIFFGLRCLCWYPAFLNSHQRVCSLTGNVVEFAIFSTILARHKFCCIFMILSKYLTHCNLTAMLSFALKKNIPSVRAIFVGEFWIHVDVEREVQGLREEVAMLEGLLRECLHCTTGFFTKETN